MSIFALKVPGKGVRAQIAPRGAPRQCVPRHRPPRPEDAIAHEPADVLVAVPNVANADQIDQLLLLVLHLQEDSKVFLRAAPETAGRVGFFQNGVDLDYFNPARVFAKPFAAEAVPIVFTGTMDYRPNIEGVEWFARQILPLVRRNHPKAEFWIVGSYPSARVTKLAQNSAIRVTGRVADVRPYLAHAACVVAPLHIARGLQNKVLEAMAMARPVVATPAACEGLSAKAGQDLLLAETADAFAGAVSLVVAGGSQDLGHQARLCVESGYNWSRNLKVLDELFQSTNDRADMLEAPPCGGPETIVMRAVSNLSIAALASLIIPVAATAADVTPPPRAPAPVYVAPPFSWTGFYLGGNFGGTSASTTLTDNLTGASLTAHRSGWLDGGQAGFNYQIGNFVWGAEGTFEERERLVVVLALALRGRGRDELDELVIIRSRRIREDQRAHRT